MSVAPRTPGQPIARERPSGTGQTFRFAPGRAIEVVAPEGSRRLFPSQFISAKHAPPSHLTELVERRELLASIDRHRDRRLVLVEAPAGYGKTSLLAQWRDRVIGRGARVAWLALERSDRTAAQFVAALASALAHAGLALPDELLRAAPMVRPDALLDALLRHGERSPVETWLIVEDWHLVDGDEAGGIVEAMARRLPVGWHILLSSRSRPRLNLLAYRARGQLLEFGRDDLRLSTTEIRSLLGANLSAATVDDLCEMTEGWPIALRLAQLWLSTYDDLPTLRRSFVGSIDGMADYLAAEVFAGLDPAMQDFLLETSICRRFNGELADAVRQRSDSAVPMASLRSLQGLAIPLDGGGAWYRHHRIFAEFLEGERRRRLPASRRAALHRNAADWFEREALLLDAVEHAHRSGDEARAAALLEGAGCLDLCIRYGAPAVRPLLDSVPPDLVRRRPRLRAAHVAMNLKLGSIAEAGRALAELEEHLAGHDVDAALRRDVIVVGSLRECFIDDVPSLDDLARHRRSMRELAGADWWVLGLMFNVRGRLELRRGAIGDAVRSLDQADAVFARGGSVHGHFFMLANAAVCRLFLGELAEAARGLAEARDALTRGIEAADSYAGVTRTIEAVLRYERGELAEAGAAAEAAFAGLERAEGCFEQYFLCTLVAARCALAATGLDAALRAIDRGRGLAHYHGLSRVDYLLDCLQARLLLDGGRPDDASWLAGSAELAAEPVGGGWIEGDYLAPVRCLLALRAGEAGRGRSLAAAMARRCRDGGRVPGEVRAHLLTALAETALGDQAAARQALRTAIRCAAPEQIRQPFFEHGPALSAILQGVQREADGLAAAASDFLADLVVRLNVAAKASSHVGRLTAGERAVLAQLEPGRSNKMIARRLAMSENAVKFHLKNVFRKLEIDSRAAAAEIARRLPDAGGASGRA